MKAIHLDAIGVVSVQEVPDPTVESPTDVVVDVIATTICGSDLHLVGGHMGGETGYVLGHEYVGVVREVGGAVREFQVGDRVIGPPAPWCGNCDHCRAGKAAYCRHGGVLGAGKTFGGFGGTQAQRLRVPFGDRDLVRVPDHVTDAAALGVGDALMTGATGARHACTGIGQAIAVFGCGPIGLMAIHYAAALGASTIIAIDPVTKRLELAKQLGATHTISALDPRAEVGAITDGRGVDGVVDAAGVAATFAAALDVLAPCGRLAVLGIPGEPFEFQVAAALFKTVDLWTGLGDIRMVDELMALVAAGKLDPSPVFNGEFTLDEVPELYRRLAAPGHGIVKALIRPNEA